MRMQYSLLVKTSGKACVLSIRIQSHIIFLYILIIVPTFNVTPSNFYVVEATHSERCYYYYIIIIAIVLITIILISIIIITIIIVINPQHACMRGLQ